MNLTGTGDEPSDDDVLQTFLELVERFHDDDAPPADPGGFAVLASSSLLGRETGLSYQAIELYCLLLSHAQNDTQTVSRSQLNPPRLSEMDISRIWRQELAPLMEKNLLDALPFPSAHPGAAAGLSRETKRRLLQAYVFVAVFSILTVAILNQEDAASKTTLFLGGSALQAAAYCAALVVRAFDKMYPPEEQ